MPTTHVYIIRNDIERDQSVFEIGNRYLELTTWSKLPSMLLNLLNTLLPSFETMEAIDCMLTKQLRLTRAPPLVSMVQQLGRWSIENLSKYPRIRF
jgi:hypothetical protein